MGKTVNLGNFAQELGDFADEHIDDLKKGAVRGIVRSIPELVRNSPVDTGKYASSWDFTALETKVLLGNFAPHAAVIERGARPFTPPIRPLLEWAKRVLMDSSQPPNYSPQVWGLARGVQNKIAKEGMKPRHILEKNLPMIIENMKQEMAKIG